MVLGLLAIGMGAAYLSSVPASSAQQLVSTATVEAKTIAEFLMSRIAGHVEKGGALRALGNDASSQRRSRLLLAIGGVSAIFVAQKLYNRFIKARSIQGSTVLVTGASQVVSLRVEHRERSPDDQLILTCVVVRCARELGPQSQQRWSQSTRGGHGHAFMCVLIELSCPSCAEVPSVYSWSQGRRTSCSECVTASTTPVTRQTSQQRALPWTRQVPSKFDVLRVRFDRQCEIVSLARCMAVHSLGVLVADELPCTPDIVVNCAGAGTWRFLSESTVDELRGNFAAPFMAAMWTSRAVLPAMVARRSGLILNVQSPAAYGPWGGATGYVAGRWALRGLSQALQADLQGTGVYVQVCCGLGGWFVSPRRGSRARRRQPGASNGWCWCTGGGVAAHTVGILQEQSRVARACPRHSLVVGNALCIKRCPRRH